MGSIEQENQLEPMRHQYDGVEIASKHSRFAFFWDCGTGKTITMLWICRVKPMKTLVVCPKSIMETAWLRDAEHFPRLRVDVAWSSDKTDREYLLRGADQDVVITNYDTAKRNIKLIKAAEYQRLILDESSAIKNYKSQVSKKMIELADTMKSVYLLSATPAPNNETEYWPQLRTLSPVLSGQSYYRFIGHYLKEKRKRYGDGNSYVVGYELKDNRKEEFETLLKRCSWSLRKEDCVDLPEQVDEIRSVTLTREERKAYNEVREFLAAEIEEHGMKNIVSFNVEGKTIKLRQLAGGNLYIEGGHVKRIGISKLDELCDVLKEIGNRKVVIWAEFTAEIDAIYKRLIDANKNVAIIDGRSKHTTQHVKDFQEGDLQYLVCHPQAAGHGITLTAANYAVYYSLGYSYEYHKQSRDRIHRKGQTSKCTYIYLMAEDTIDGELLNVVRRKKTKHEAMMASLSKNNERVKA